MAISFCLAVSLSGSSSNHVVRRPDRQPRRLADMLAVDLHRQRLRLQPEARAFLARRVGLVARQLLAHPLAVRLLPAPLDIGDDAFEGFPRRVGAHPVVIGERDGLAARAEQDHVLHLLRQLAPGRLHRDVEVVRDGFQRLRVIGRGVAGARPGHDRALAQATATGRARQAQTRISARCRGHRISGTRRTGC